MATIDPVSQPPAVAWQQVANHKIEHMLWGIYIALFFTVLVPQALRFME